MAQKYSEISIKFDYTFEFTEYDRNIAETPTSPTAIVYDNAGAVMATITGTLSGNDMSFLFLAADNTVLGRNNKIEITYTIGTTIKKINLLFDVVNVAILNNVSDENLFERLKDLRKMARFNSQSTAVGTTTTLIDSNLSAAPRIEWKGGMMEIIFEDLTVDNKLVEIQSFNGSDTLTFSPAHTAVIPDNTFYILRASYQDQINNAYDHVMGRVRSKVGVLAGYIDNNVINEMVIYRALYMITMAESDQEGDKWDYRSKTFKMEFEALFSTFGEAYDTDEDGNISDAEDANRPDFFSISLRR